MTAALDFQARIESVTKILGIGEYTTAATETVKLIEQALRQMVRQYLDQMNDQVRQDVHAAVKKRVRGDGGIEKLTLGQMVYTLRDARFWKEWARLTGKSLSSLQVLDLEKLTQLRNKIMHDGAEATKTEAEFLLHGLKMILEIFGLVNFDATPQPMSTHNSPNAGHYVCELPNNLNTRIIEFLESLPNLSDEVGQKAFLEEAGLDAALQKQIRLNVPLAKFVPPLVTTLMKYGRLRDGRYALHAILETSKHSIGQDRQVDCDALIQDLKAYLPGSPSEGCATANGNKTSEAKGVQGGINISNVGNVNGNGSTNPIIVIGGNYRTNAS